MEIFCKAYHQAGSLRGMGVALGYPARQGLNGVTRDMWLGRRGIPRDRVPCLLKLTDVSLNYFSSNIISKEESKEVDSWVDYYEEYKVRHNITE